MDRNEFRAKGMLISSMLIFGTIGIFRRYIPMQSGTLALLRGLIGMLFLLIALKLSGKHLDRNGVRRNLPVLLVSGGVLGFNWILLFEAYQYTSVATATLCYYMAPVIVMLLSPVLLKEKLSVRKGICIAAAVIGLALVSGITDFTGSNGNEWKGILFGLGAAVFYAGVILLNKQIRGLTAFDRTVFQLGASSLILLPYTVYSGGFAATELTLTVVLSVLIVGVLHTGVAYALYFGSMNDLKAQTVALYSYIDPAAAVVLSALVLKEGMSYAELVGTILVLGATLLSELPEKGKLM